MRGTHDPEVTSLGSRRLRCERRNRGVWEYLIQRHIRREPLEIQAKVPLASIHKDVRQLAVASIEKGRRDTNFLVIESCQQHSSRRFQRGNILPVKSLSDFF